MHPLFLLFLLIFSRLQGQGYPLNAGPNPVDPGGLAAPCCVSHPDSAAVLCFAFRTDNSGPPESVAEVLNQFDIARWQWPGSTVIASTFDAWWAEFKSVTPQLPVVTSEQGETWLTGFAADPPKNAFYRAASREYTACKASGACDDNDPRIYNFLRMLMKVRPHFSSQPATFGTRRLTPPRLSVTAWCRLSYTVLSTFFRTQMPEHTWGLPTINDDGNYTVSVYRSC